MKNRIAIKTCPQCKHGSARRRDKCCPNCGIPLCIVNGKYVSGKEWGGTAKVYEEFVGRMATLGVPLYYPKGSQAYIKEMAQAKKVIENAARYLGYAARQDIDPVDFAMLVLETIFTDQGYANWCQKMTSIQQCNGRIFWGVAPKTLRGVAVKEKYEQSNEYAAGCGFDIAGLPVLG